MNNRKKGLIISGAIILLTLGIATVRILFFPPSGFYWTTPLDLILLAPALPFLTLIWLYPSSIGVVTAISFILATVFWLLVGYGIGTWMDKKQNKK